MKTKFSEFSTLVFIMIQILVVGLIHIARISGHKN